MTPQEAIEILKNGSFSAQQTLRARKIAISAIERQIPKKPLKEYGGAYRCPNCQMKRFDPKWVGTKYCDCGQALDWEDEGDSEKENLNSTYNRIRLTAV